MNTQSEGILSSGRRRGLQRSAWSTILRDKGGPGDPKTSHFLLFFYFNLQSEDYENSKRKSGTRNAIEIPPLLS